jgi:hypothetical protein
MSRRSSRVHGLHTQEGGDEVNQGNQVARNVIPDMVQNGQLPPPPCAPTPVDLAAVMQQQNWIIEMLVTVLTSQAQGNQGNFRPAVPQNNSKIGDFNRLQPPNFGGSDNPMEADDWLREIEMKLEVVHVVDRDKVLMVVQQLKGPALAWWQSYREVNEDAAEMFWANFIMIFRE